MLKFRVTSASSTQECGSMTTSAAIPKIRRDNRRRNSLVVEETGRFSTRRSSVPDEAFISITSSARSDVESPGLANHGYSHSTGDILNASTLEDDTKFLDTKQPRELKSSRFFGHTSNSFVHTGKKLLARGRELSKSSNDKFNPEEPTYKGYSDFDEISLGGVNAEVESIKDRYGFVGSTGDSGFLGSVSSLASTCSRVPLQTLDFADLGIHTTTFDPRTFTLTKFNRMKANSQKPRYKWTHWLQFVIACLSFSFGLCNIVSFPLATYHNGKGAFLIAHTVLTLGIALPLLYLLAAIGQFSGRGSLESWKMVPVARGIGTAMLTAMTMVAIHHSISIAHALYYVILSLHRDLPWMKCDVGWGATSDCKWHLGQSFFGTSEDSATCKTHLKSEEECSLESITKRPAWQLWNNFVLGSSVDKDLGLPKWDLVVALLISWLLVFLCVMRGMRIYSRVLWMTGSLPFVLILILTLRFGTQSSAGIWDLVQVYPGDFSNLNLWSEAGCWAITSLTISIGVFISLASYNPSDYPLHFAMPVIISGNLIVTFVSCIFMFGIKDVLINNGLVLNGYDYAFTVLPEHFTSETLPNIWSYLFYSMIALAELNTISVLSDTVISAMEECSKWAGKSRLLTSALFCTSAWLIALPYTTPQGRQLYHLFNNYLIGAPPLLLALFVFTAVIMFYGVQRLSENVNSMMGSRMWALTRFWLTIASPVALLAVTVSYFSAWKQPTYLKRAYDSAHIAVAWSAATLIIAQVPLYAVGRILVAIYKGESVRALFKADPNWPNGAERKPAFRHTHSFSRYLSRRTTLHERQDIPMGDM